MANSTRSSSAGRGGTRLSAPALYARFATLVILTLQLNACAAEPALPAGPEWKSGELRRAEDGRVQLVPARRPEAASAATTRKPAPAAAASAGVHTKPKARQGRQAVVSWTAPTTYVDGRPIRGSLGYKVHYGQRIGSYSKTVNAGSRTQVTIKELAPGTTYYFVVSAYTPQGAESSYSKPVAARVEP